MANRERGDLLRETHWEVRREVVSIYKAARTSLIRRNIQNPTDAEVAEHVSEVRKRPHAWSLLLKRAENIRTFELKAKIGITSRTNKDPTPRDIRKAREELASEYRIIDNDPNESKRFLDRVLFSNDN